jgi:hypothetical protein
MKRILLTILAAGTMLAGVGMADAEVYFRYRGMMPTVIAAAEPEPPVFEIAKLSLTLVASGVVTNPDSDPWFIEHTMWVPDTPLGVLVKLENKNELPATVKIRSHFGTLGVMYGGGCSLVPEGAPQVEITIPAGGSAHCITTSRPVDELVAPGDITNARIWVTELNGEWLSLLEKGISFEIVYDRDW